MLGARHANAADSAIDESKRLVKLLKRKHTSQIRTVDECSSIKAASYAWFNNHRPALTSSFDDARLSELDGMYKTLLAASDGAPSRSKLVAIAQGLREQLVTLRSEAIQAPSANAPWERQVRPPDFSAFVSDAEMLSVLETRWHECSACLAAGPPLRPL